MTVKVTNITQISIQKMVTDTKNLLQDEDTIIIKNKMLEKNMVSGGEGVAQILLTYQAIICAALFVSPFITGLMTAQIK